MMAGSASINPLLFALTVGLILAWKIAGFIGADYFLLNWIGTPWNRHEFKEEPTQPEVGKVPQPSFGGAAGD